MLNNVYTPGALDGFIPGQPYRHVSADTKPQQDLQERGLWRAYIEQKVFDAKGQDGAGRNWCQQCHFDDLHCGCKTIRLDKNFKPSAWNAEVGYLWIGSKRQTIALTSCALFPDGHTYFRALRPACSKQHTTQQCAIKWFASDDCDQLCSDWDFSSRNYRRMAGVT